MVLREPEAEIIRELAARLLSGEPLRALCRDLDAREIRTTRGKAWQPTPLGRMLASPRIAGLRQHGKDKDGRPHIIGPAQWPAIISEQDSARIRTLLSDPSRRTRRSGERYQRYLLSGLCRCGRCGAKMDSRRRQDGTRRYVCDKRTGKPGCGHVFVTAAPVEADVANWFLLERMHDPAFLRSLRGDGPDTSAAAAEVSRLRQLKDDLMRERTAGLIDASDYATARRDITERLEQAERQAARGVAAPVLASFAQAAGAARDYWESLTFDQRHAVLKSAVQYVTIDPAAVKGRNKYDPRRLTVAWWQPPGDGLISGAEGPADDEG